MQILTEALTEDDIIDNLDSSDTNKVLSAKQGKVLGDAVFEDSTIVEPFPIEMHSPNGYYYKSGGIFVSSEGQRATNKISVSESRKKYYEGSYTYSCTVELDREIWNRFRGSNEMVC